MDENADTDEMLALEGIIDLNLKFFLFHLLEIFNV